MHRDVLYDYKVDLTKVSVRKRPPKRFALDFLLTSI